MAGPAEIAAMARQRDTLRRKFREILRQTLNLSEVNESDTRNSQLQQSMIASRRKIILAQYAMSESACIQ